MTELQANRDAFDRGLLDYLCGFVTDERLAKMRRVLAERTRYLCVAVEDIYQPHNASAVLRTCDSFGIQDVHIIENRNSYRINPGVELGTAQWLTMSYHRESENNTRPAIEKLRNAGYRIVATTPHERQRSIEEFDLAAGPAALLFGNELEGLSDVCLDLADEHLVVPMVGFVESFNISVSAAIVLYHLSNELRRSGIDYRLARAEQDQILLEWVRRSVGRSEALQNEYYKRRGAT